MGFFDKLKGDKKTGNEPNDDLPDMNPEPASLADAARQTKAQQKEFRARETAATAVAENEGLPSVNRNRGNNKLVTIFGFIFILSAAAAMIVAVNGDKDKKKKKQKQPDQKEQIANNLPPLVIPAAPAPITLTPAAPVPLTGQPTGVQVPAIKPGTSGAQPIALAGGKAPQQMGTNGKPVQTWEERKMGGTLLVDAKQSSAAAHRDAARPEVMSDDDAQDQSMASKRPGDRSGSGDQNKLATELEPTITKGVSASMLPDRNFLITKGTSLDCALETALDSSVPGLTTCRLTSDVYSDNGQVLLLDRGSQLVGEYQGGMKQGQVRLFVLWTRVKTPNGVIVSLNSPGTDALGRSGLDGWVDNHFSQRFGAAILMSLVQDSVKELLRNNNGGTTNVYGGTINGGEKIIEKILESTVNIPPTIVKNQGDHIQVMVARDLDFSSVYGLWVKK
ncbi:type IV secretion system protein VirB10 [Xylella fastidiosa]|uniref:Conjugal transfer protein n=1 Tax=Xylella fastidiosa (strain 9a5c) TaxID=160492 RepID=Q9PHJ1_XYLFA|nr:type IV secretion system protein VirB10 [Xylella fastidiosa]AAF85583.1 conjugal transfer protein [Xylella fastidiosa 9a5c]KXB10330.1 conjugal transfer protein [Xylella fastidiosa]KXB18636.1 conjugal transfer protein [Xylella fastidiosa]